MITSKITDSRQESFHELLKLSNQDSGRVVTKADRVLAALLDGKSFNHFEAERELHDHCLHTTVAELQRRRELTIERKYETVIGYQCLPTRCKRYWMSPEERQRIQARRKRTLEHWTELCLLSEEISTKFKNKA